MCTVLVQLHWFHSSSIRQLLMTSWWTSCSFGRYRRQIIFYIIATTGIQMAACVTYCKTPLISEIKPQSSSVNYVGCNTDQNDQTHQPRRFVVEVDLAFGGFLGCSQVWSGGHNWPVLSAFGADFQKKDLVKKSSRCTSVHSGRGPLLLCGSSWSFIYF